MLVNAPTRCPHSLQSRLLFDVVRFPLIFPARRHSIFARNSSSDASFNNKSLANFPRSSQLRTRTAEPLALARLPTSTILRSLLLGAFFSSSILFTPGFTLLKTISESPGRMLNPDRNPILRVCYGKEIEIRKPSQTLVDNLSHSHQGFDQELEFWKQGNLETLDMIGDGDYLGIKYSGGGKRITDDLLHGKRPPKAFEESMDAIVQKATAQNCRIWIDAEQQVLQHSIDRWTIDLMRKYNRHGKAVIYNTLQAYLKASREKLAYQLQVAHREGWTLAIKLVRGAYISNDIRERIHDTKAQTDESYDSIVRELLSGHVDGIPAQDFPKMQLFLAGHNASSVSKASTLIRDLQGQGKLRTLPEFGQLQGMADQLGCELLQSGEDTAGTFQSGAHQVAVPRVYKCLTWGSVQECMQYLVRRAVENRGATGTVRDGMPALARELRRRMIGALLRRR